MFAIESFVFAFGNNVNANKNDMLTIGNFVKGIKNFVIANGSYMSAIKNFIVAINNYEKDGLSFMICLPVFELDAFYLRKLGACCTKDGLNISFHVQSCVYQTYCAGIEDSVSVKSAITPISISVNYIGVSCFKLCQ